MPSFDDLAPGTTFESPARAVDAALIRACVELGGYTHPLFNDPAYAAESALGTIPLPGEAVLLIMGGLAEQTGRFGEDVLALVGFEHVEFKRPVVEGQVIRLQVVVLERGEPKPGRGVVGMRWTCLGGDAVFCSAVATMLFSR